MGDLLHLFRRKIKSEDILQELGREEMNDLFPVRKGSGQRSDLIVLAVMGTGFADWFGHIYILQNGIDSAILNL